MNVNTNAQRAVDQYDAWSIQPFNRQVTSIEWVADRWTPCMAATQLISILVSTCYYSLLTLWLEPCADVIESAAARRYNKIGGGGAARRGRWSSLISHTSFKRFQQRASVIKVCTFNNYLLRLCGLKFGKNIIKTGL